MTIPTYITILRIVFVPLQLFFAYYYPLAAVILFVLLAFSDWLDGFIARKFDMVSDIGKFLDPLADKVLVTALMIFFLQKGYIDSASLILVISREFIVQGIRMVALEKGKIAIGASFTAKAKTFIFMVSLFFMLLAQQNVGIFLYYIGVLLALISLIEYCWTNRSLFDGK